MELFCSGIPGVLRIIFLDLKSISLLILIFLSSFAALAQRSRIEGKLYWLAPSPYSASASVVAYSGIPLEIFIYELTTAAEIDYEDGLISKVHSALVHRSFTRWDGSFKIKLAPGTYSVFVLYKNRFFGNLEDSEGHISPAYVRPKSRAWITITMNYSGYH